MRNTTVLLLLLAACRPLGRAPGASGNNFLNPILAVDENLEFLELRSFSHRIRGLIDERKKTGAASHVSVYFRDLENGPLFGVEMEEKFTPASLLKVPFMMAILKEAETDPALLSRRYRADKVMMSRTNFATEALKRDSEYSVDELLRAMIAASDNEAFAVLRLVVGAEPFNEIFRELGFLIPGVRGMDDFMTVREYATFFRVLYNASYLSKPMSQKALEYLAASEFKQGLAAGVPPGVAVAHKYGERFLNTAVQRQLHDCGIVYHPAKPYVLCVMTRGEDFEKMSGVIRDISALVYAEIDSQIKR